MMMTTRAVHSLVSEGGSSQEIAIFIGWMLHGTTKAGQVISGHVYL